MEVVDHPYLKGVRCREDGAVYVPQSGTNKAHWTFGTPDKENYRSVAVSRKQYKVHRLVCEAFHGLFPPDKPEVDHINRDPADNRPGNLRWCTHSENNHNKKVRDEALAKYGVLPSDDKAAYNRARYANNPEVRERHKARMRERYANDPEFRERHATRMRARYAKKKAEMAPK